MGQVSNRLQMLQFLTMDSFARGYVRGVIEARMLICLGLRVQRLQDLGVFISPARYHSVPTIGV